MRTNSREICPLPYGSGNYKVEVYSTITNEEGYNIYNKKAEFSFYATPSSTGPFLLKAGKVNYSSSNEFIKKAAEIFSESSSNEEAVNKVGEWLSNYLDYRVTTSTGTYSYNVDLDNVYNNGYGVCYDYSVVFASMLRSQGVPCKVIYGDYGSTGHAWNEVYLNGWIRYDIVRSGIAPYNWESIW